MKVLEENLDLLIENAAKIISPLWPLQTFIACNPLQGLESLHFEDAIATGERFFGTKLDSKEDLFSDVNRELIKWLQVFLDEGQASIKMPGREKGFYLAWLDLVPFDKNLTVFKGENWFSALPTKVERALIFCLQELGVLDEEIEEFFKYMLAELPGWVGYIKWRSEYQNKIQGQKGAISLKDFLAVRLIITCAFKGSDNGKFLKTKKVSLKKLNQEFFKDLERKEEEYRQQLLQKIIPEVIKIKKSKQDRQRPYAQLVFCIDVRSEQFRMRLEQEGSYETIGFAGFFGLPITFHNCNTDSSFDCCPVLLKPRHTVYEERIENEGSAIFRTKARKSFLRLLHRFYEDLKYNFATPFALVETLGVWCGFWMGIRTLMPRTSVRLKKDAKESIFPSSPTVLKIQIPIRDQVNYAESALRMMGLTKNFSRLIVFCGHGGKTENNPYSSALDCGACGGNPGGSNAKILAAILNDSVVRNSLLKRGISIPNDSLFVGAEHLTTTDEVVFDRSIKSDSHGEILKKLKEDIQKAGIANSQYRCRTFGLIKAAVDAQKEVLTRSCDWAEVRPEWGLARNACFIVGPRSITKEIDLDGRCFLHSYDWLEDENGQSLETILTAPMVVAEWINMQYFFSSWNQGSYGSGSKITQNVTGQIGIMQGNSSDLMQGLPLQSVYLADDKRYHDPIRLQVIIYAPLSRVDVIIQKHVIVKTLFFNKWVVPVVIDPRESTAYHLSEEGMWEEIPISI